MPTIGGIVVPTGAAADGRRTLGDVVDELSRPIDAADSTVRALAGDAFRAAVRTMNSKGLWPWEIQNEQIAITANNAFSTATGAIKKPLSMYYLSSTTGRPYMRIAHIPYDRFREKFNLDVVGQPHAYTEVNLFETGQIQWFPTPSSNYTAIFDYYRVTPGPQDDNEAIEVPDGPLECYMAFAWYELVKRTPSGKLMMSLAEARGGAMLAFRELSAHVNTPGDRVRQVNPDRSSVWS